MQFSLLVLSVRVDVMVAIIIIVFSYSNFPFSLDFALTWKIYTCFIVLWFEIFIGKYFSLQLFEVDCLFVFPLIY